MQYAAEESGLPAVEQIAAWARAAWQQRAASAEVVIRVAGEDESRQLNRTYRDQDKPTNVLSFPYEPTAAAAPGPLGDILICAPVVQREAVEQSKQVQAHWAHMVVHGMLHLQGFDHANDSDAASMESLETDILTGLGFPAPYADETQ